MIWPFSFKLWWDIQISLPFLITGSVWCKWRLVALSCESFCIRYDSILCAHLQSLVLCSELYYVIWTLRLVVRYLYWEWTELIDQSLNCCGKWMCLILRRLMSLKFIHRHVIVSDFGLGGPAVSRWLAALQSSHWLCYISMTGSEYFTHAASSLRCYSVPLVIVRPVFVDTTIVVYTLAITVFSLFVTWALSFLALFWTTGSLTCALDCSTRAGRSGFSRW